jgi:hypothetical protein
VQNPLKFLSSSHSFYSSLQVHHKAIFYDDFQLTQLHLLLATLVANVFVISFQFPFDNCFNSQEFSFLSTAAAARKHLRHSHSDIFFLTLCFVRYSANPNWKRIIHSFLSLPALLSTYPRAQYQTKKAIKTFNSLS